MTILFMGGGLDSLVPSSSTVTEFNGNSTVQDSTFSRNVTRLGTSGGSDTNFGSTPTWGAVQELYVHAAINPSYDVTGCDVFRLQNAGTDNFRLACTSAGVLQLYYLSATDTWTQIGSDVALPSSSALQHIDVYFKTGASGAAALYLGGTERTTGSASITFSTDVTGATFNGGSGSSYVSQIAIADEPTIGWRVAQGYMSGAGSDTAWTGDYTGVDEIVLSDTDFINSGTADQVETFTVTYPSAFTGYIPRAVCVSARAKRGGSGPQNIQLALRSGGTNYFSSTKSLGLGYTAVQNIWETNPATSADFLASQLTSLQAGVKSIT